MAKSREWPSCPVYQCAECGREASVETLTYDEYEGCYWCSINTEDSHDCDGKMRWVRDDPAQFVSIGMYETHRVYGGPEEGGWYYDAGVLSPMTLRNFSPEHWGTDNKDAGHAQWYYEVLQQMAEERNAENRKDRNTELRYTVALHVNQTVPTHFPKNRPRYS